MSVVTAAISGIAGACDALALQKKTPNNFNATAAAGAASSMDPVADNQATTQSIPSTHLQTIRLRSEVSNMAKNQAKQETEEGEPWIGEDAGDFGEASNDTTAPIKARMLMRHKIEDLLESRRLKQAIADYESFDVDEEARNARRLH